MTPGPLPPDEALQLPHHARKETHLPGTRGPVPPGASRRRPLPLSLAALAFLALAGNAPAEDGPGRVSAGGLVFTPPAGWVRRDDPASRATFLSPPGVGDDASFILYPVTPDVPGTQQEAHARMLANVTGAGKVEGELQAGATGLFQWTRATLTLQGGQKMRLALYTARSGTTVGVAVFGAKPALFRKHLPQVEQLIEGLNFSDAPGPVSIQGLVFRLTKGWTRKDEANGIAALHPPPPSGPLEPRWDYVLYVLPSQPLHGSHWRTHREVLQDALRSSGLKDPTVPTHDPAGPGVFIRSTLAGRDAGGGIRPLALYSARSAESIECVLVVGQEDRNALDTLFSRATPRKPPKPARRPRIVEAYRRGDQKLYVNPGGGALAPGSLQYERIWLRSDGVADFTTVYPRGHAASPETLKLDPDLLSGRTGAWKPAGDSQVELLRAAGASPELYLRRDGRLERDGQVWQPMPPVDGLRLEGTWKLDDLGITFTKDLRYEDRGVAAFVAVGDVSPTRPPRVGSGTYEIREWTLFLHDDGGGSWSTDFSTMGPDSKDLSVILLRTTALRKQ